MKLFKSLLVAPAALGLLAPLSATANDINLAEVSNYSSNRAVKDISIKEFDAAKEIAVTNSRVDSLEVQMNEFEAGSFSDTTTLGGKAIFTLGALSESAGLGEGTAMQYTYQMDLNTSFTNAGDDLYVRLKTGNAATQFKNKEYNTYLSSTNTYNDTLKVDKIWYSFPVTDSITAWVGPKIENYYMHGASPSIYKPVLKSFKLGGNGAAYGASTDSGIGVSYNADNGFSLSTNLVSDQNGTGSGFLSDEVDENWSTQIAWTKPNYHVSLMVAQKYDGWSDSYFSTRAGAARGSGINSTNYGLRAYWRPDDSGSAIPEVSVGYDWSEIDDKASTIDETDAYFVGLTWKDIIQADDRIGFAFGQPQKREDETTDPLTYELYYSFKPNDSMTITPAIFGSTDPSGRTGVDDDTHGAVIETTFKF